jgi:ribonuclease J
MSSRDPLRIVPLGGLGEFGMNCMVVERGEDAVMIDCGVMFPEDHMMGIDRVIPDFSYLYELGDRLKGIVLTHGHEDHIGALPYLLPEFNVPVFASKFTGALLDRKLDEYPAARGAQIERFEPRNPFKLGGFELEALQVTHSIVDASGIAIRAGGDLAIHTGDFKLDPSPIDGRTSDIERFRELGDEGVRLLMSDSTNVEVSGKSKSESEVPDFLRPIFEETKGRIFVTTFASHIHRIQNVVDLCHEFGRLIAIVGRSMESNASLATRTGHLRIPGSLLISPREAEKLPAGDVCFLATGSQGEPGSAMTRIAMMEMRNLAPAPGDAVVFSSRVIPGNDKAIGAVIDELYRSGAEVYDSRRRPVHVSGHACREELRDMLDIVRPECFVPLHGQFRNLVHHARLAVETGVEERNCFCLVDGEVLKIQDGQPKRAASVSVGRVLIDGSVVGDVDDSILRDRRHISEDGVAMVILGVSRQTGEIVVGPDFVTRGLSAPEQRDDDFDELKKLIRDRVRSMPRAAIADEAELQENVRQTARRYFRKVLGRRPVVVPYILEM